MSDYKHGIYGETGSASNVVDTTQVTTPVYIGTLPIHRISEQAIKSVKHYYTDKALMLLISSIKDAKKLNIISDDWGAYSLCEAIDVHFKRESSIAPILLIAPIKNTGEAPSISAENLNITLIKNGTSYIGYVNNPRASIEDMAITVSGTTSETIIEDGDVTYEYDGDRIKIVISKEGVSLDSALVSVSFNEVSSAQMSTSDFTECLDIIDRIEGVTNRIPNILCAPRYSDLPEYHDLMVQKAIDKVDGKWNIVLAVDIENSDTNESALAWKNTNSYNNLLEKVFFRKLGYNGKIYHMSVVWTALAQALDAQNDNIPCESASNKPVFADSICDDDGKAIYISEQEANELNKKGITTAIATKGQIRLWGSHMGNYDFDKLSDIAVEDRFDVAVRMNAYMNNYLQYHYLDEVDSTINRKDIDSIINSVQMWLDSLVNESKLLYATVEFDADSDIANGDIVFNIHVTYPFVAKSVTFKVIYTDKGLYVFTSTEEGVEE